jgi:exonuclease VII large subunit
MALLVIFTVHTTSAFCVELFGSSLINEQLEWIKSEVDALDIKNSAKKKILALQEALQYLEAQVVKKISKAESRLQKYSDKINQAKENKELQDFKKKVKEAEEELFDFHRIQGIIDTMKAKLSA